MAALLAAVHNSALALFRLLGCRELKLQAEHFADIAQCCSACIQGTLHGQWLECIQ